MYNIYLYKENDILDVIKGYEDNRLLDIIKLNYFKHFISAEHLEENTLYKMIISPKYEITHAKKIKNDFKYNRHTGTISIESYSRGLKILLKYKVRRFKIFSGQIYLVTETEIRPEDGHELLKLGFMKDLLTNCYYCNLEN